MPFNIWCEKCNNHIAKGVRFNAEKNKNGAFLTTAIWHFRMKCHLCSNWIEMETDPENNNYKMISGARQKIETWEHDEEAHVLKPMDEEDARKLVDDPLFRIEHQRQDEERKLADVPRVQQLLNRSDAILKDDYDMSKMLRQKFRVSR
jgi:coiled-coil domain-containing protein 130